MTLTIRTRLVWICLANGIDPLAAFDMPALEFAERVRAARMGSFS